MNTLTILFIINANRERNVKKKSLYFLDINFSKNKKYMMIIYKIIIKMF